MAKTGIQVVWFKRDLRIHDHAPLSNAAAAGFVLPVFAIEPRQAPDSALRQSLQTRFGFQPGEYYSQPFDFEAKARHWKKHLYELQHMPEAQEASKAILDKLASQRRPPTAISFRCSRRAGQAVKAT